MRAFRQGSFGSKMSDIRQERRFVTTRPRSASDLDDYGERVLNIRRRQELTSATNRARELERQYDSRVAKNPSFANARPLSRSEADALRAEEQKSRIRSRLAQVRARENINAAQRRQEFDRVRTQASQRVAQALADDYREWKTEANPDRYERGAEYFERSRQFVPSSVPIHRPTHQHTKQISRERPRVRDAWREADDAYFEPQEANRSRRDSQRQTLEELYQELEIQQNELSSLWNKHLRNVKHVSSIAEQRDDSSPERKIDDVEWPPRSKHNMDPGRGKGRPQTKSEHARGEAAVPTSLRSRDVIEVTGPKALELLEEDEPLATTTWFAMAEEELSNGSSDAHNRVRTHRELDPEKVRVRPASRIVLDDDIEIEEKDASPRVSEIRRAEPPSHLLERLRRGEKAHVDAKEMHARTERIYSRLPEVAEVRKELLKREEAERRRQLVKDFDNRRRQEVHALSKPRQRSSSLRSIEGEY